MAKPAKSRALGKKLLLGVVIGSAPIVGASPTAAQDLTSETLAQADVSQEERAFFELAANSGEPARINTFLNAYPDSTLVRQLLANLPPETLSLVEREAVTRVNPTVLRGLSVGTRQSLGLGEWSSEREEQGPSVTRRNNGWGNGDQDPPGRSGPRNNAENGPLGDGYAN